MFVLRMPRRPPHSARAATTVKRGRPKGPPSQLMSTTGFLRPAAPPSRRRPSVVSFLPTCTFSYRHFVFHVEPGRPCFVGIRVCAPGMTEQTRLSSVSVAMYRTSRSSYDYRFESTVGYQMPCRELWGFLCRVKAFISRCNRVTLLRLNLL